jgi:hypothetical protein
MVPLRFVGVVAAALVGAFIGVLVAWPYHTYTGIEGAFPLHARSLTFLHPIRYEPMTVTALPSEIWRAWTDKEP